MFVRPTKVLTLVAVGMLAVFVSAMQTASAQSYLWDGFAENAQHTTLSSIGSQSLLDIRWQDQIDLDVQYTRGDLYAHYGSPMITAGNTVVAPVKTTATGGFEVAGLNSATGSSLWSLSSDYVVPPTGAWTPAYSPNLQSSGVMDYAGADGTVLQANINSAGSVAPTRLAFYGTANYNADPSAYSNIYIDTPITTDSAGDMYFGYMVSGTPAIASMGSGGIARISASGVGTFVSADAATGNSSMVRALENCAPAISSDGSSVYVAVNSGNFGTGYLLQLNSSTLATENKVVPMDPQTGSPALLTDDGTSSPTIGPDGNVYLGVYDDDHTSRGWLEQYSSNLTTTKTPGGFGWDDTVSIVPASMVPSYHGTSSYLLMTKYNNYLETGGGGQNMIAILDPNAPTTDNQRNNGTGATIMTVVESILGPTSYPGGGMYEWCDNNAVVDPATDSILVTSEDGHLYRWNLATNTLTQSISLGGGLGEAYTPTIIGPDGTVYALNNGVLNSIGLPTTAWTGTASSAWNTTAANWLTGSPTPGSTYSNGAVLLFGNTSGNTSITIQAGGIQPGWMTFTNTGAVRGGSDYTIGGGPIGGGAGITLDGTSGVGGAVILTGANSFTGGVNVNVGRLNLKNALALGNSSGVSVSFSAALELQNTSGHSATFGLTANGSAPIPLILAGSGISDAGALNNVAGNNSFAGPISIGLGSGGATIASTSTASGDQLTLSGGIAVATGNTLTYIGAGNTIVSGAINLAAGSATSNAALAVGGSGTVRITAQPTFGAASAIQVASGVLQFNVTGGSTSIGSGVVATVSPGATLQLAGITSTLSDSASGNVVNIVNNATTAGGGGFSVVGTNQSVGTVTGAGDTVVGDGTHPATLAAQQIIQHTLTIGAGSTVAIVASEAVSQASANGGTAGSSATSLAISPNDAIIPSADLNTPTLASAIQTAIASQWITSERVQALDRRVSAIETIASENSTADLSPLERAAWQSLLDSVGSTSDASALLGTPSDASASARAAAVPEPSSIVLLTFGAMLLGCKSLRPARILTSAETFHRRLAS